MATGMPLFKKSVQVQIPCSTL